MSKMTIDEVLDTLNILKPLNPDITYRINKYTPLEDLDITNILGVLLDSYSKPDIPLDLDRHAKSSLINAGYCADFALCCIMFLKVITEDNFDKLDIKVYNWETIHTFFTINGTLYDAECICGVEFTEEKRAEYFISQVISSALIMNEYFTLLSEDGKPLFQFNEKCVLKIGKDVVKSDEYIEISESVYTGEEFIKIMKERNKEYEE